MLLSTHDDAFAGELAAVLGSAGFDVHAAAAGRPGAKGPRRLRQVLGTGILRMRCPIPSPRSKAELDRSFSELYRTHLRDVYSYAYYRVGNHHDAEDLTEQTFLQAYRHYERALRESDGRPLRPWLIRIAHNLAANFYRDRARKPESAIEDAAVISAPHTTETLVEGREELERDPRRRPAAARRPPRGADHALRARHGQPRDRARARPHRRRDEGAAAPRDQAARGDRRRAGGRERA